MPFKYLFLIISIALISGCTNVGQIFSEHMQLNSIHKAGNKIAAGNVTIVVGTALVANGTKKIIEGQKELKAAKIVLANSVGISQKE